MDTLKRTIWYDTDSEPPKNYIWIKADGKAYEYNAGTKQWEESKEFSNASLDMFNEMTDEEKTQVRKDLGLYYEAKETEEKTAKYTGQSESLTLSGYAKVSDDTPVKDDILFGVYMGDEESFTTTDTDDGYFVNVGHIAESVRVVLNDSQGNDPGIYAIISGDQSGIIYNGTTTVVHKVPEKYLPETVAKTEDVVKAQVSIVNTDLAGNSQVENPKEGDIETFPEHVIKEYCDGQWIDRNTAQRTYTFENPGYTGSSPTYNILNPKYGDVAYCDEKLLTNIAYSSNGEQTALDAMNLRHLKLKITSTAWIIYPSGTLTIEFGNHSGWIITTGKIETFGSGWYEQQSIEDWNSGASIYLDLPPSVIDWMGDTVTCTKSNVNDNWNIGISCVYPSITYIYDGTTWVRQTTTVEKLKEKVETNTPSPILLNTLPDASITTTAGLKEIGITSNDVRRAADGLCTGIRYSHRDPYTSLDYVDFIQVKSAYYDSGNNYRLKFDYGVNEYAITINGSDQTVSVTVTTN